MSLVSEQCISFVKQFEGFCADVEPDCVGVPTLGYGMTGSEIAGLSHVTEEQATQLLRNHINNDYATPIKRDLDSKGVQLNQNQFDALVSMAYNVGVGSLLNSTLYKNICAGVRDASTITEDFCMWDKAGGRTVDGLLRRRQAEAQMFFNSGNSASSSLDKKYTYVEANIMGDKNIAVVQASLNLIKIYDDDNTPLVVDGILGERTKQAYIRFQEVIDVPRTGIWDNTCNQALCYICNWYKWMSQNNRWNFNGN